ncbi:MAG: glycine cleavage system protein H [Deltaproteobacteria bacterium]|nr:glycine cleavage system protein H [Deltaproteobacteria bacterium]
MSAIIGIVEQVGIFLAGIAVRLGVVAVAALALLVPAVLLWAAFRGAAWARRRAQGLTEAGGLRFRPGLRYAPGHTWLRLRAGAVRVGVDDLVQGLLPWAMTVRLPHPGAILRAGEPAAVLAAGDREAVICAPVDGVVTAVNGDAIRDPSLVKSDCYARGWLFQMKAEGDGLTRLVADGAARAWLAAEGERLHRWLEPRLGLAAADGGTLAGPVAPHLAPADWKALQEEFLRR